MTIASDLMLLDLDSKGKYRPAVPRHLAAGLAAAELLELAFLERVALEDGRVQIKDPRPVHEHVLDDVVSRIAESLQHGGPTVTSWVANRQDQRVATWGSYLNEQGLVVATSSRIRLNRPTVYRPTADGESHKAHLVGRLESLINGGDVSAELAVLASLVVATGMKTVVGLNPDDEQRFVDAVNGLDISRKVPEHVAESLVALRTATTTAVGAAMGLTPLLP